MSELHSTDPNSTWEQVAPHLDDALGELSESDRDALMMRYFERKSAREMAQNLRISDEAAQKRLTRAVEHLRELFAKRGVTVGASGLAVSLSANVVQAAPFGLSVTLSPAAAYSGTTIASTVSTGTAKAIAMTTTQKALITAALIAAVATAIYEARRATAQREQASSLQQRQASLTDQIEQNGRERDEALRQIVALVDENKRLQAGAAELIRLRGEVARLRATVTAAPRSAVSRTNAEPLHPWLERVRRLKARVEEVPGAWIPELRLATEQDWLDVCREDLETIADYRKAMSSLRGIVEQRFVLLLQKALQKFQASGEAQFPSAVSQLGPFLDSPSDQEMLDRWQIASAHSFPSLQLGNGDVIAQTPVDVELDPLWALGPRGYGIIASVPKEQRLEWIGSLMRAFLTSGQTLENPSQLREVAATSVQKKALEHFLSEFNAMSVGQQAETLNELREVEAR